ncbi:acyltransferase family protein [Janibacter melonis]|uniref:acyltransferase family protein n=1 Tax=Janibacter melonis TaxID=262209 RepID=UPI001787108D
MTSLRFVAAFAVVLYHVSLFQNPFEAMRWVASLGYCGVSFFFVLSGFVLTWAHRPGDRVRDFYARRFARVWPLHAVMTLVVVVVFVVDARPQEWLDLALVLTLTQAWAPDGAMHYAYNGPSWTLSCEAFFYLMFPVLLVLATRWRRPGRTAAAVVTLLALGSAVVIAAAPVLAPRLGVTPTQFSGFLLYVLPAYRIGEFALGIVLALAIRSGWRPRFSPASAGVVCVGAYVTITVVAAAAFDGDILRLPYGVVDLTMLLPLAALIAAAASADLGGRTGLLRSPRLVALGQASFALYLVHEVLLRLGARFDVDGTAALTARAAATVLVALVVARFAHLRVEAPLERVLRRRLTGGLPRAAPTGLVAPMTSAAQPARRRGGTR